MCEGKGWMQRFPSPDRVLAQCGPELIESHMGYISACFPDAGWMWLRCLCSPLGFLQSGVSLSQQEELEDVFLLLIGPYVWRSVLAIITAATCTPGAGALLNLVRIFLAWRLVYTRCSGARVASDGCNLPHTRLMISGAFKWCLVRNYSIWPSVA